MSTIPVQKRRPRTEKNIDETIDESFPASDPPSYSRTAGAGAPKREKPKDKEEGDKE
ncbi:hypothetical protein [Aestuariivirga sp.]|uniref:hypothetical protein n=1 Tax=Aestuariivirga sp. TaxID=2650926 RepID=UPI003BAA5D87